MTMPAETLTYVDCAPKGYIPKRAKQEFLDRHKDDLVLVTRDGRYTVKLEAVPLSDRWLKALQRKAEKDPSLESNA